MGRSYPDDWETRRRAVYRRDGYTCQNCGARGGAGGETELHAHHVVPKSKGGTHKQTNLITVCKGCHDAIHGRGTAPVPVGAGSLSDRVTRAIDRHYRTDESDDGYVRLGTSDEPSAAQQYVDRDRNQRYDGCPNCGRHSLTVSWVGLQPGSKVKVVECEGCGAQYGEELTKQDDQLQRVLHEVDDPTELDPVSSAVWHELTVQLRLWLHG